MLCVVALPANMRHRSDTVQRAHARAMPAALPDDVARRASQGVDDMLIAFECCSRAPPKYESSFVPRDEIL